MRPPFASSFQKNGGPAAKRAAVANLQAVMSISERRPALVEVDRKMIRYRSSRPPDVALRGRLHDLANEGRRFGYRRLFMLLRGRVNLSVSTVFTGFTGEGLAVGKRRAHRKAVGTRESILVEARLNARWSLDFVHDQFANGRRFRVLNIVDATKECRSWSGYVDLRTARCSRTGGDLRATRQAEDNAGPLFAQAAYSRSVFFPNAKRLVGEQASL